MKRSNEIGGARGSYSSLNVDLEGIIHSRVSVSGKEGHVVPYHQTTINGQAQFLMRGLSY